MENNNKSSNNFFSGFLLGVLVGAAIVFLLGTKKGKKILKAISEEGSENISKIINKLEKSVDLEGESLDEEDPPLVKASGGVKSMVNQQEKQTKELIQEEFNARVKVSEEKPKVRRFFRGISRRVN